MSQAEVLARDVLLLSRNTLLVHLRFLDAALSQFVFTPALLPFATDGRKLHYAPGMSCCTPSAAARRQKQQTAELNRLRKAVRQFTAEKLYRYFLDQPPQDPETLRELFQGDDHTPWYLPPKVQDSEAAGTQEQDGNKSSQTGESLSNGGDEPRNGSGFFAAMEQTWKDVAQWMQMDLETFSRLQGDQSRALTRNLRAVNREKFDYVYYTYGLKLYRNMPLIEPLGYREDFTKVIIE